MGNDYTRGFRSYCSAPTKTKNKEINILYETATGNFMTKTKKESKRMII